MPPYLGYFPGCGGFYVFRDAVAICILTGSCKILKGENLIFHGMIVV